MVANEITESAGFPLSACSQLRARDLGWKIQLISVTVRTTLELLQNRRTLRMEWYIVLLIVLEIVWGLYDRILALPWFSP